MTKTTIVYLYKQALKRVISKELTNLLYYIVVSSILGL